MITANCKVSWDKFDQEADDLANMQRASRQRVGMSGEKPRGKRILGVKSHQVKTKVWCRFTRVKLKIQ